jgi:hypothetical protein
MDTDSIEYLLLNYFNEVIWIKENPAFFNIIEKSRVNGELTINNKQEIYHLKELLTSSIEELNNSLYLHLLDCNSYDISYYTKGIRKIFGNNDRLIYNELSKLDQKNTWIITSQKILERFFFTRKTVCFNVYVCDLFDDKIVIGSKDSKLILNENLKEFYLDLSNIKILNLK